MNKRWWPVPMLACALLLAQSFQIAAADSALEVAQKARGRSYDVPTPQPVPTLGPITPGGDDDMPNRGGTVVGPKTPQNAGANGHVGPAGPTKAVWLARVESIRSFGLQLLRHVK